MRAMIPLMLVMTGLTACGGGDPDDSGSVDDTDVEDTGPKTFEDFIDVTEEANIDASCFAAGDTWLTQDVDDAKKFTATMSGTIEDFETSDPVDGAKLEVWASDDISGAAVNSTLADANGKVTIDVDTCVSTAYRVTTGDHIKETTDTWEFHQFYAADGTDGVVPEAFNSVSDATYTIIPSLLGVTIQSDKGIIAGTVFGCDDEPVEGAQVVVKDQNGDVLDVVVKYFIDDFPNRDQPYTSPDGLWIAMNVPPGTVNIEMYAVTEAGAEPGYLGNTQVISSESVINISNIYTGFDKGIKVPASCLVTDAPAK